ncbi:monocarboxylate transporter 10 isoform X1 [Neocloeon triangulifer]|uniref:monocarboxylate transporter 10 isoform X1 n=1 Tax=Neocloeon triangulifer TaxID=2078957 RepID=UPI00286ED40A|nr:monocarboxylate transporter 10 isoform X1 [Neocloeon triangulifer]
MPYKSNSREKMLPNKEPWTPADGGFRAWLVVLSSFLINGLIFGIINSYSVIYFDLQKNLEANGIHDSSYKASLVGSLTIGATFAFSPLAGILTDRLGHRQTTMIGGALAVMGMVMSSLLIKYVKALYLTYGILFGLGASLAYTPSLAILGFHFKQRLGLVNGIVTAGSSVFTILIPLAFGKLIPLIGLEWVLRSIACLMIFIVVAANLFEIPAGAAKVPDSSTEKKECLNFEIWKNKKYVIWALAIPISLFGYFVPYVHMVKFVSVNFPDADGKILVMCIGLTSGVGRIIFGKIADMPNVDRILLQQISFISIGSLTMLLVVAPAWSYMILIALGMGLFDGCFISLLGPIAFDLCGSEGASQAIGFLLGLCSIPLTVGPPVAGKLFDHFNSYTVPFLLAGGPPILGAIALFAIKCVKSEPKNNSQGLHNSV